MRSTALSAGVALLFGAAAASAQTISYINFLQFDLQSFRSQATAGIFQDDVDMVGDAANLTLIEGNRLFTNFANLSDPATLGDNILTYSLDHFGAPTGNDHFDTGSYLVGWVGRYSQESEYAFSVFYQRNSAKAMFEDLSGDFDIGGAAPPLTGFDAEASGFSRFIVHNDTTGAIIADQTTTYDLQRYDERSAMDFDFGVARDLSEETTLGARFFWEDDQLDSFSGGSVEVLNRVADVNGVLSETLRTVTEYQGTGEEAFKSREIGASLDLDYHPWEEQDINVRFDIFGSKLVNPSFESTASVRGILGPVWWSDGSFRVNRGDLTTFTPIAAGQVGVPGTQPLAAAQENSSFSTFAYSPYPGGPVAFIPTDSVDDDRTGIGFNAKVQWDREWAGGENRLWAGFGHRGLDIDATFTSGTRAGNAFWWNAGAGDRMATNATLEQTLTTGREGDMSQNVFEIGTRWNRPINENVSAGLGVILSRETLTEDYQETDEVLEVSSFDDGDPGINMLYAATTNNPLYNEERTEFRQAEAVDVEDEFRTTFVRLPVGGQFHFGERWTVNLGATHVIVNSERETSIDEPAAGNSPGVTTYTDIGGQGTAPVPNPSYDFFGFEGNQTVTDKARDNRTTYWYGLSVMLTDAAQLDINGFFDTASNDRTQGDDGTVPNPDYDDSSQILDVDFFRNLAISLKYIFW